MRRQLAPGASQPADSVVPVPATAPQDGASPCEPEHLGVYSVCIYLTVKNENPSPDQVMTTQSVVEMDRLVVSRCDRPCNR